MMNYGGPDPHCSALMHARRYGELVARKLATRVGTYLRSRNVACASDLFLVTSESTVVSFLKTHWVRLLVGLMVNCSAWPTAIMLLKTR